MIGFCLTDPKSIKAMKEEMDKLYRSMGIIKSKEE